jgi:signal transduction histidine kinase
MTVRRHLTRIMMSLVLGILLAAMISGGLLLSSAIDGIAGARIGRLAGLVESQANRLAADTERLLRIAASWLTLDDMSLDHRSLNRRFMPILAAYPQYSSMLIADSDGSEWLLFRKSDGTWLNRLTSPRDQDGKHRFLHWDDSDTLVRDERLDSDYRPTERPWFREASSRPPGETAWTEIYRFFTSDEPGVTAALRVPAKEDGKDLILALDLRLVDIARYVDSHPLGERGLAVALSGEGRILALSHLSGEPHLPAPDELVFRPVLGLDYGPLQEGVDLWLSRGEQPLRDRVIVHDWEPWKVGFRELDLGDEDLWLGAYLPVSELIPGLFAQISVFGLLLLAAVAAALYLALRTARRFSLPLELLAFNSRRIGDLDFAKPPRIESPIQEIDQLAGAQDTMRALLARAHDRLVRQHQELETAQERLIRAAKLESVGQLAAGVAHEVKNPLAIAQMGVDFLRGETAASSPTQQVLVDMDEAISRADGVIKGLLDFSRVGKLELKPGDLNQVIDSSLHLVDHELKRRDIRADLHLDKDLPPLPLDADKLSQVFVNLFMNAAQAMGKGGVLGVSTSLRRLTDHSGADRDSTALFAAGEQAVWVEVTDTGPGIDDDRLPHIFDPFFTTKAAGEGSGLGLSVSRSIVELHEGAIDIRNRTGGGVSAVLLFKPQKAMADEEKDPGSGR